MARVVIVGAGLVGSSVAHQLAQAGYSVTVVDKAAAAGHGSTSASSGVVRFTYSTPDSVALSWESKHAWELWRQHLGASDAEPLATFHKVGMLMLDVPLLSLERSAELLAAAGIPYELLDASQVAAMVPGMDIGRYWPNKRIDDPAFWEDGEGAITGIYSPDGGFIDDPALAAQNLADAAKRHGARFRFRTVVTAIEKTDGRVSGVRLDSGELIEADIVVNAAGPWSGKVNAMAGVGDAWTVTLAPMRQEVHHVAPPHSLGSIPAVSDMDLGTYFRLQPDGSLLVGGTEPECDELQWLDDADDASMAPTQKQFEAQVTRLARRLPDLGVPGAPTGVVGVYDVSSDWAPIYDMTEVPGYYVAVGTSGNQFKNGPVIGQMMLTLIDAVEAGRDHDADPVVFHGPHTGLDINMRSFSRVRERNPDSTGTVMG